jgi:hypothetical protein
MTDIERLLRDDARVSLPDDGFTARVMGALPAGAAMPRAWIHPALVIGSAALGCVLAIILAPAGASVLQGFADLTQLKAFTPGAFTALGIGVALLVSALVIAIETD